MSKQTWQSEVETNHIPFWAGSSGEQRKDEGASLRGLGLMWQGLAWRAGGLFIDTSSLSILMVLIWKNSMEICCIDWRMISLVFKVTKFITQKLLVLETSHLSGVQSHQASDIDGNYSYLAKHRKQRYKSNQGRQCSKEGTASLPLDR